MKNLPVLSRGSQRDLPNMMNINLVSYRMRGETSKALKRSELGESRHHIYNDKKKQQAKISPDYYREQERDPVLAYQE